ncbi:helix-turn-helix domain-containing protein [Enterovibrio coralii]|uniref:Sigma-54 factor interaction domain-containing protein n=1 Tax=Enterovibrio coralii TaxID=294935 RepID=A0A135I7Z6_9GAMM|nr:helix-turn-helix domain-containing protein [Enterovibrio coralii]KXF81569.1 hypothetical protein ATN88_02480 [Enterovibrio coralii]
MRRSGDRYKKWQLHTQNQWPNRKEAQDPLVQSWWEDRHLCAFDWQIQKKPSADSLLKNRNSASSYLDYLYSAELLSHLGEGAAWCLLDAEGIVLAFLAAPSMRPLVEERGIGEGFNFSKHLVGTTAYSLSKEKNDSALLYCFETYKKSLHAFASVCVPVRNDPRGYSLMVLLDEEHESNLTFALSRLERLARYPSENLSKLTLYGNILDALPQMIFVFNSEGVLRFRNAQAKRNSTSAGLLADGVTVFNYASLIQATESSLVRELPDARVTVSVKKQYLGEDTLCFVDIKHESVNDDAWKHRVVSQCLAKDSYLEKAIAQRGKTGLRLFLTSEVGSGERYIVNFVSTHLKEKALHTLDCMAGFSGMETAATTKAQFTHCLQRANGNVLCIENIHLLAPDLKGALLKVLSSGLITDADGSLVPLNIDLICCSSSKYDWQESRVSRLLVLMLAGIQLDLKPLSADKTRLDFALETALDELSVREKKHLIVDRTARDVLLNYRWPGNFLELFQVLESAVLHCFNDVVSLDDLPERTKQQPKGGKGFANIIEAERSAIIMAWRENGGRVTKVADALGLSRTTLWRKMKKLEIDRQCLVEGKY